MRGGRSPGFARMSPDIAVWKFSFPLVKEHGDPPRRSLQKHQRCEACGRRDRASGGAAGAGEFWRHRAPRFRRHCCTAARYLQERFQALACFCRLVLMETSLRSRDTCTPAGSACMFRNQGREAPSAQSGGFAGYPRAGHPYKNMCIHAQTLKSNK